MKILIFYYYSITITITAKYVIIITITITITITYYPMSGTNITIVTKHTFSNLLKYKSLVPREATVIIVLL